MTDHFADALEWLNPIEGGWYSGKLKNGQPNPADPNPTMRGITQKTYDAWRADHGFLLKSVHLLSEIEHAAIYRTRYWEPAGCPVISWPLGLCVFDTAVNCGVGNAKIFLRRSTEPIQYIAVREAYYRAVVAHSPEKGPNLPGWLARNAKLKTAVSTWVS